MKSNFEGLARELLAVYDGGGTSENLDGLDLMSAYAVESEFRRLREGQGHHAVGRKAGYANKAVWRALKLETLVWAHMYDDTVHYSPVNGSSAGTAEFALGSLKGARLEPEIVFKLKDATGAGLEAVEWLAIGFEIIACPFSDWKFQPAEFVAAWGLHRGLIIGQPCPVTTEKIPVLTDQLANFKFKLLRNDEFIEEGTGRNCLRSPALCLAEFTSAVQRQPACEPLQAGELFSSGTLTPAQPIQANETWRVELEGLDIPALSLRVR